MNGRYIFTSESVTEGHPDKVCDQISDAILTACLREDKHSRVACECFAGKDFLVISGEITTNAKIDYEKVARETIEEIGYTDLESPFNCYTTKIDVRVNTQSPDIAQGVDIGGAGDQGIMFGYACNETPELMPAPIQYAHDMAKLMTFLRKNNPTYANIFKPDGKTQVSMVYEDGKPVGVDTVLVSTQHFEGYTSEMLKELIIKDVIIPTFENTGFDLSSTKILVNPTGKFVIGGPEGDTGLTGRKIIVDTYGGMGRHGGGCFSGKDPTKVDRSAAYMARHIAKSIVGNGLANRCEVQLAYAIGVAEPVSIYVDTFGTGAKSSEEITEMLKQAFDLTPAGIINYLNLLDVNYKEVAAYGHMGRDELNVKWEDICKL